MKPLKKLPRKYIRRLSAGELSGYRSLGIVARIKLVIRLIFSW